MIAGFTIGAFSAPSGLIVTSIALCMIASILALFSGEEEYEPGYAPKRNWWPMIFLWLILIVFSLSFLNGIFAETS
jgi:hypothetical protein